MACVLVVDDDDALRDVVCEAIADAGYVVDQAANGQEALAKMRAASPCIVLLDLMMPVMDGWEVVAAMNLDPALAGVPVCVVSAQDRVAPPQTAGLLKKPVSIAKLIGMISLHCGKP